MFSLPLNPFMDKKDALDIYIPFLKKHKSVIDTVYFTCRIPPFSQDSMGALLDGEKEHVKLIRQALFMREETGVPVSAVFNSPVVSPDMENLKVFMAHFAPLYEAGIRSMTLVQAHWVKTIKESFPGCKIRSSVVRPVSNAQNFIDAGLAGYDTVQVDRNLMRNQRELSQIAKARIFLRETHGVETDICLLANEQCRGACPWQEEHYLYNASRKKESQKPYMYSDLAAGTCAKWRAGDPAFPLKICRIPYRKKDWDGMLKYVQSFKMHGRDEVSLLSGSMRIVKNFASGNKIIDGDQYRFFKENKIGEDKIGAWLQTIKNCGSQCWRCGLCDEIMKGKKPWKSRA